MNSFTVDMLFYFRRMFDFIKNIDGDIVECGVGYGRSLTMLAFLINEEMKGRSLWGFDSFQGFPEPSEEDRSIRAPKRGDWGNFSIYDVLLLLETSGIDKEFIRTQITLIKGFFNESLSKYTGDAIALLHLDCDLYESYYTALNQLYPRVARGGVILFDEYLGTIDNLHFPGAYKAITEFFKEDISLIQRDRISGKYFMIKPR